MSSELLIILGPTAVGKTALSISLAKMLNGEIISGDSMQVYQGLDIGTGKATVAERSEVPHHLIDEISPSETFSMQDFQALARQKIAEVQNRGRLPILVGGTGLYIEAVTYDYQVPPATENQELRVRLHRLAAEQGNETLHRRLSAVDPVTAKRLHPNDVKRVIRAIEVYEATGKPFSEFKQQRTPYYERMLWIGLTMPRDVLYQRINERVDQMLTAGWIDEVNALRARGLDRQLTALQAIGYRELIRYLDDELPYDQAISLIKQNTRKYAKRQFSWFRHMPDIHWFDMTKNEISTEIQQFVAGKFIANRE